MNNNTQQRLMSIFWEATLKCNAACPFCGSNCLKESSDEIDGDAVCRTFESIAEAFDPGAVMVNITGGEPLLRKDLFSIAEKIHSLGFPWGMVTNGSLISEETIRLMKKNGMRTISVSIDDLFEKHERIRHLPGAFSRIIESIRKLDQEQFLDSIQITTVVTKNNLDSLEDMLLYFSSLPVDSWRLAIMDPIGRGSGERGLLLGKEELARYFDFLDRHAFHPRPVLMTSCSHYLGYRDTLYRRHPFQCEAGKSVASILADGSIFVCPNVPRYKELVQGNILRDDFVKIWKEGFRFFRDTDSRKKGGCADCPSWESCMGDSLHTWNFEKKTPDFCIRQFEEDLQEASPVPPQLLQRLKAQVNCLKGMRVSYGSTSSKTVYFTPFAAEEMFYYFHWGMVHPVNICEQMMAAAGHVIQEQIWIEELIPVPLIGRSGNKAFLSAENHEYVEAEILLMNENMTKYDQPLFDEDPSFRFLGYIHSHPCEMDAVMSLSDLEFHTYLQQTGISPLLSGIVNPQKGELCIYLDSIYYPVTAVLLMDESHIKKWRLNYIV